MPKTHFLRNISFLRGLTLWELRQIQKIAKVRNFSRGEQIFSKEDSGSSLFIVLQGRIKIYATSRTGRIKTFAFLDRGDFFGEMALLEGNTRSASAMAVQDAGLLIIHKRDFKRLLQSDSSLTLKLLRTLSERLRRANQEIESLSFQNVLGRVIRTLFQLSKKYGRRTQGNRIRIQTPITQQELAELAGTARELVTRALGSLKRMGCISEQDGRILLTDPEKMKSWI